MPTSTWMIVDYVAHSYNDFEDKGHDGELREKMTYNKEIEKALRTDY